MNWEAIFALKWYEVTKYRTAVGGGMHPTMILIAMNWDTWNRLPPEVQKIFDELSPWGEEVMLDADNAVDGKCVSKIKEVGNEIIYLSPEEKARWIELTEPVVDDWCAKIDAMGLPGTELVKEVRRLGAELESSK